MKHENKLIGLFFMLVQFISPLRERIMKLCTKSEQPSKHPALQETCRKMIVKVVVAMVRLFLLLRKWLRKLYQAKSPKWKRAWNSPYCQITVFRVIPFASCCFLFFCIGLWYQSIQYENHFDAIVRTKIAKEQKLMADDTKASETPSTSNVVTVKAATIPKPKVTTTPSPTATPTQKATLPPLLEAKVTLTPSLLPEKTAVAGTLLKEGSSNATAGNLGTAGTLSTATLPNWQSALSVSSGSIQSLETLLTNTSDKLSTKKKEADMITVTTNHKVNIHKDIYLDSEVLGVVPKGTKLQVSVKSVKDNFGYLYISYNGINGYIYYWFTDFLKIRGITSPVSEVFQTPQKGYVISDGCLYSEPDVTSKVKAKLPERTPVVILESIDFFPSYFVERNWLKIQVSGKVIGYAKDHNIGTYAVEFVLHDPSNGKKSFDKKEVSKDTSDAKNADDKDNDKKNANTKPSDKKASAKKVSDVKNSDKKNAKDSNISNKDKKSDSDDDNTGKDGNSRKKSTTNGRNTGSGSSTGKKSSSDDSNVGSGGSTGKKSSSDDSNVGSGGWDGKKAKTAFGIKLDLYKRYNVTKSPITKSGGVKSFRNHFETYYSEQVLSGGGLKIPGRHSGIKKRGSKYGKTEDGTVRDKDGYICLASHNKYIPKGTIILTSLGPGKVYDCCTCTTRNPKKHIDIYVSW